MPGIKYHCPVCVAEHPRYTPCPRARKRRSAVEQRPEWRKLYGTGWWRRVRLQVLERQPFCKCGEPATEVDHIIPHRGDEDKFRDVKNLQGMCKPCHSAKTARGD